MVRAGMLESDSPHILPGYRIAVVGAGAVGCYYGGRLAAGGRDVRFLMRSDLAVVRERGLRVSSVDGDFELGKVSVFGSTEEIGVCDLVIISMKATEEANACLLKWIPPLLKEGTMLLTLQNGLGVDALLAEHFGADRVMGGLCFVCINRSGPGVIEHLAQGRISLGEFGGYPLPRTHDVASEFKRCGVNCVVVENLERERWIKLVWNIPFNGLAIAAGGIDTRQILADPALEALTRGLMAEVIKAAAGEGHRIDDSLIDTMIERTRGMGAYQPSSLIDYLNGGAIEVEAIWGEACRRANAAGVEVGRMEALYQLIRYRAGG